MNDKEKERIDNSIIKVRIKDSSLGLRICDARWFAVANIKEMVPPRDGTLEDSIQPREDDVFNLITTIDYSGLVCVILFDTKSGLSYFAAEDDVEIIKEERI